MKLVNFNPDKLTPQDIEEIYEQCRDGIESKFDPARNPNLDNELPGLTELEREEIKRDLLDELSMRSSFYLLAYIETLFRTDFVLRLETNNKKKYQDVLTQAYKRVYNPTKRLFNYHLVEVIFENWKRFAINKPNSKEMTDILNTLPQYFEFRNWMAHGRYWVFRESNYIRKYNYVHIKMLLAQIEQYFGGLLKVKNFGVEA